MVNIYEKGFTYKLGRKTGTIRWEEMNLGDLERRTNAVGAGGLIMSLMMTADKKFVIHYGDGKKVEFNSANVPDVKGLARQISEMYSKST